MHSDYARQGVKIYLAHPEGSGMVLIAECVDTGSADNVLTALQRTEIKGESADIIRAALRAYAFEASQYLTSTMRSVDNARSHVQQDPTCRTAAANLDRDEKLLDDLQRRSADVQRALDLYVIRD